MIPDKKWLRNLLEREIAGAMVDLRSYKAQARRESLTSFDKRQVKVAETRKAEAEAWLKTLEIK